jgi:hypothetical protein
VPREVSPGLCSPAIPDTRPPGRAQVASGFGAFRVLLLIAWPEEWREAVEATSI